MSGPPVFRRSPRLTPPLPSGEISIPSPPPKPGNTSNSLLVMLLPIVFATAAMAMVGYLTHMGAMLWFSIPMMLASGLASVVTYLYQRKKSKKDAEERERKYLKLLENSGMRLKKLRADQRKIMLDNDPDPGECMERVKSLSRSLWCRTPQDEDFLALRVGIGKGRLTVSVKPPEAHDPLNPDPLIVKAREIALSFKRVSGVPLVMPLVKLGVSGVAGERRDVLDLVRAMLVQLATHHSPIEVKLAVIYPSEEDPEWEWVRWLPHVWDGSGRLRFIARDKTGVHNMLKNLEEFFHRRKREAQESHSADNITYLPYFVVVIADSSMVEGEPFIQHMLKEGPEYGIFPVFLAERVKAFPKECTGWVRLRDDGGTLTFTELQKVSHHFEPDVVDVDFAREYARFIAPIRLKSVATEEIPSLVSLLDLFDTREVEELDVERRWSESERASKTLSVPIGVKAGGDLLRIDVDACRAYSQDNQGFSTIVSGL